MNVLITITVFCCHCFFYDSTVFDFKQTGNNSYTVAIGQIYLLPLNIPLIIVKAIHWAYACRTSDSMCTRVSRPSICTGGGKIPKIFTYIGCF